MYSLQTKRNDHLQLQTKRNNLFNVVYKLSEKKKGFSNERAWSGHETNAVPLALAVQCTCTGNAMITFFTLFDPTPFDKKCRSEHQTLFPLFGGETKQNIQYAIKNWRRERPGNEASHMHRDSDARRSPRAQDPDLISQ